METTKMKIEYRKLTDKESDPWLPLTNIDELIWNGVYALRVIEDDGSLGLPFRFGNDDTVTLVLKDHSHEGKLQNSRTVVQTITRVERSTGEVHTYTRTRFCVDGKHRWNNWELVTENAGSAAGITEIPKATTTVLGGVIIGDGLSVDGDGKVSISDRSIDENKLTAALSSKIDETSRKATLANTFSLNDGIVVNFGALSENSDPYTGTRYCAYSDKIFANGETITVNPGYIIYAYKIFDGEQEVMYISNVGEKTFVLEEKGYYYQIEFGKEDHNQFTEADLRQVVKFFTRKPVVWNADSHIDKFIIQGSYNISGNRSKTSDGLPISDTGNFTARLTVLACGSFVMQVLMILGASDGNVYMRIKQNATWDAWKPLF